jgi:phosphoglycolate phosphatase-like HAD superfamily hydrolase
VAFFFEDVAPMQLLKNFNAEVIIFDKDGTLIDFDFMWGTWTLQLAERLQTVTGLDARQALCASYGYDLARRKILPDGKLTCTPMWRLREMMTEVAQSLGLSGRSARRAVEQAWFVPDPVNLARPFTDIQMLFTNIRKHGIRIAIATTDDRHATEAMLRAFTSTELVDTMVCADDGIEAKPAPDMINTICGRLGIEPRNAIVIGDTVADLQMARTAGAGYVIGVLSGVGLLDNLTPLADILIDNVDSLQSSFIVKDKVEAYLPESISSFKGFHPDPAY